jgi:hypothetical protein
MKNRLDFDTPNEVPPAIPLKPRRTSTRPSSANRPICPFCYEPGVHVSAAQCLRALERNLSN